MKQVLVLGASGSLGSQVLNYLDGRDKYIIKGLGGWHHIKTIEDLAEKYNCVFSHKKSSHSTYDIVASKKWDVIVNCVSGTEGIELSWFCCRYTKKLIVGNKETLFINGTTFLNQFSKRLEIIPLDSELTSLWYLINVHKLKSKELIITASGGSLHRREDLIKMSLDEILNHPIWNMGTQITIDSSSMINKIFEIYSAATLFNISPEKVKALICRTSEIHAGVIKDSKILALDFKPSMIEAIKIAFEKNNSCANIKEISKSILEPIEKDIYPIYGIKDIIFLSQHNRTQLLNLSINLGRELLLKQISFFEMVERITKFYKSKS